MIDRFRPEVEPQKERINYTVRVATPEDGVRIADMHYASWLVTYPNEAAGISVEILKKFQGDPERKRAKWTGYLEGDREINREQVFVVADGPELVGFCKVIKQGRRGFINSLYLDPSYQGRGAGATVLQTGLDWLDKDLPIELEVADYNQTAKAFYRRFGFVDAGAGKEVELGEGVIMKTDLMRRPPENEAGE